MRNGKTFEDNDSFIRLKFDECFCLWKTINQRDGKKASLKWRPFFSSPQVSWFRRQGESLSVLTIGEETFSADHRFSLALIENRGKVYCILRLAIRWPYKFKRVNGTECLRDTRAHVRV